MIKLSDCLDKNKCNFNVLRLVCCLLIIYGHSFSLISTSSKDIILSLIDLPAANIGIKVFFFLSGLLVINSIVSKRNPLEYVTNRIIRIYPAFFFVIIITAFVIGPICTNLSLSQYYSDSNLWLYLKTNLQFKIWGNNDLGLPGVFISNFYPLAVNSPTWAICAEAFAYVVILSFFLIGLFDRRIAVFVLLFLIYDSTLDSSLIFFFLPYNNSNFKYIAFCYAVGGLFAIYKDRIVINSLQVVGVFLLSQLLKGGWLYPYLIYLSVFILVLYISTRPCVVNLPDFPDLSYGIYLFGWPIQQMICYLLPNLPHAISLLLNIIIVTCISYVTNILIERPFVHLGKVISKNLQLLNERLADKTGLR